jgi:3',5'-cyclic AMP phosphodiesterase CpdA
MLLADPQFGIASHLLKKYSGRTTPDHPGEMVAPVGTDETGWKYEQERFSRLIEVANSLKPEFVVILGDMVMQWNNAKQAESVKEVAQGLSSSIPLHWVPGNHDVGVDFLSPSSESIEAYRASFGPDHYTFVAGPCRVVAFNSALFDKPDGAPDEYEAQLEWLKQELSKPLADEVHHTIAMAHHPLFLQDADEDYGTFNLPKPQRKLLIDLFNSSGVEYYFAGHTHANVISRHESLQMVVTTSIGVTQSGRASGYRMVTADSESISHSFHVLD